VARGLQNPDAMKALPVLFLIVGACTDMEGKAIGPEGDFGGSGSGGGTGGTGTGSGSSGSGQGTSAGQLTAGEWDDNLNYDVFHAALANSFGQLVDTASLPVDDRILLTVTDLDGSPLANARVEVANATHTFVSVPTASDGRVLLLPQLDGFTPGQVSLHVTAANGATSVGPLPGAHAFVVELQGAVPVAPASLDVAFVVDATGSMGDEIQYLKAEMTNIAQRIADGNPNVSIHYGLIVYRDVVDPYVTRVFDFTSDLAAFDANLADQSADGGGDYPEAAEVAMDQAVNALHWRDGNVARVLFHVADAPPHDPAWAAFLHSAVTARAKGIRIFPVAASGVALEAEYLMRTSAFVTLARYVFLTDDSGIGNSHEPPHIPCYQVQHLNDLLVRTIASELAGHYIDAPADQVLDTVGVWDHGTCLNSTLPPNTATLQ
jgi:hypothetical protein